VHHPELPLRILQGEVMTGQTETALILCIILASILAVLVYFIMKYR
jgi:hypothetical protein